MKCEKIEKWISDHMDGRLREEKEKSLERHLKKCPSCKAYARNLERIQEEAKILASQEVSSSYKQEFTSRLKAKISALPPELRKAAPLARRWKWAWAGVSFILVIAVGIFLYFNFAQIKSPQETYVFSFEDFLSEIYQEISDNSELEDLFNSIILISINELLEDSGWDPGLYYPEDSEKFLLLEDITEGEMEFLKTEIKKEIKY